MFLLSHALRVKNGGILLPGGEGAVTFWHKVTGAHPRTQVKKFLEQLALGQNGKLNYFYTFGFFLPPMVQEILYCNYDSNRFEQLIKPLKMSKSARINKLVIPQFHNFNPFTLLYALQIRDQKIYFPGGVKLWATAVGENKPEAGELIRSLIAQSNNP